MDNEDLKQLTARVTEALEKLDIDVWDANIFVYNFSPLDDISIDDILGEVGKGSLTAFIEIDAILGERVWDLIETFNG